jgi:hypothetical protein
LAQGGQYNMAGRRDAIAQQVAANQAAQQAPPADPWMQRFSAGPVLPLGFAGMRRSPFESDPATSRGGGG